MNDATDQKKLNPPPNTAAARLLAARDEILSLWSERVKQTVSSEKNERIPIIIDTIPAFLENLAEALAPNYPRQIATEGTSVAAEHGGERARLTRITPSELIREYQILRDVLFQILTRDAWITGHENRVIMVSIDQAMTESLMAYFLVHEGIREQISITLTHDLRTPLTAIKASAELILRSLNRPERFPVLAARIVDNVNRIDRMTQDLLDASRVRFGEKIQFEVAFCDLLPLVQEAIAQVATVHGDRFKLRGKEIHGYWNADAFRRAIENILVNAVKYGDPTAPITIKMDSTRGRVIVSVHNEGPHIPAEEQERLFQSFIRAQTVASGRKRGWGLGLAMVRGMAEGHGGSISVDSAPGRGTTFIIDVPLDSRPHLKNLKTPGT